MQNFYLFILFFLTLISVVLAFFTKNFFVYLLMAVLILLSAGFSLKRIKHLFPQKIRKYVATVHVILLEPFGLLLVYFLSFLSIFNRPFNSRKNKIPILFVHGYINFASVWLFHLIRLKRTGYGPMYFINLGYPFSSIERFAKKLKSKISKIQKETKSKEIILIGHSMGGLISSYYAGIYKKHSNVKGIITLGSPLKGTKVAKIGIGKCCREMEFNSSFIKNAQNIYPHNLMYHIVTKKDQLVVPYESGIINKKKDRKYVIDDLGHCSLLYSSRVAKKIHEWLKNIT